MIMFTKVKNKQYQSIDDYVYKRKKTSSNNLLMIMFTNVKNKQYQSIDDYVYKGKKQAVSIY